MDLLRAYVFFAWPGSHPLSALTERLPNMPLGCNRQLRLPCNLVRCTLVELSPQGVVHLESVTEGMTNQYVLETADYLEIRCQHGLIARSPKLCHQCGRIGSSWGTEFSHERMQLEETFGCPSCFHVWHIHIPVPTNELLRLYCKPSSSKLRRQAFGAWTPGSVFPLVEHPSQADVKPNPQDKLFPWEKVVYRLTYCLAKIPRFPA